MRSSRPVPTPPFVPIERTPGMRPSRIWLNPSTGLASWSCSTSIVGSDTPIFFRSVVPATPVATISSRFTAETESAKSTTWVLPGVTVTSFSCVANPMITTLTVYWPTGTLLSA